MRELRPLVDAYPEEQVVLSWTPATSAFSRTIPSRRSGPPGHRLRGTHIHDVVGDSDDGDHRAPESGWLDWNALLGALREVNYPGPWTFEVINPTRGETPEELARMTREVATRWGL